MAARDWAVGSASALVEEILVSRVSGLGDVGFKVLDEAVSEDEILRLQEEVFAKADAELARYLSGAQRQRMEQYEREAAQRLAPLLATEQLERLKKQQEAERTMMEQSLKMLDGMLGE